MRHFNTSIIGLLILTELTFLFSMILVANSMKLIPRTLETNGKLLDALKLPSITRTSGITRPPSLTKNWILNGPFSFKDLEILTVASFICSTESGDNENEGSTIVASPEWTPACSTCSEMAQAIILPFWETASKSTSFAPLMNLEITAGKSEVITESVFLK